MTRDHPNHKWWTLFAMCFALFMIMLDNTVVNVALPSIQADFDAAPSALEWVINSYVLSFAVLILLGGKLGDRYGRKRFFLVGLTVFTLASAACALAASEGQLIGARAVQGVGGALLNPLSLSILVAAFPRRELPTAIGVWAGISGLGLAVGPLLGGFLVEHVSWSAVFWINVPIGVVAFAVVAWAVVESNDPGSRSLDVVGTALVTAGLLALVWGLIETTSHSWTSSYVLGFLAAAAVILAAFVAWELRQRDPMVPLGFFRTPAFAVSSGVILLVGLALFGVVFFLTLYFQNVRGYSAMKAGAATLPMTMMVLAVAPIAGRLNSRIGPRPLMSAGMVSSSIGLLGLAQVTADSSYHAIWPFFVLLGAGIAMTMPSASSAGMSAVDPDKAGIASGVINTSRQIGGALGIAVLGAIGAQLASDRWHERTASLGGAARAGADRLTDAVVGGRVGVVESFGGARAGDAAADAFVHGMHGALYAAAALTAVAAAAALVGLRGTRPVRHAPGEAGALVEA